MEYFSFGILHLRIIILEFRMGVFSTKYIKIYNDRMLWFKPQGLYSGIKISKPNNVTYQI
jgi:hypothetical protein